MKHAAGVLRQMKNSSISKTKSIMIRDMWGGDWLRVVRTGIEVADGEELASLY